MKHRARVYCTIFVEVEVEAPDAHAAGREALSMVVGPNTDKITGHFVDHVEVAVDLPDGDTLYLDPDKT